MATSQLSHPGRLPVTLRGPLWLCRQLFSFELFFLLFLYGIHIRLILPPIPGNEAFVFGAITIIMGSWIILRDGIYRRGLLIMITGLSLIGWMIFSIGWTPSKRLVWDNFRFLVTVDLWALAAGSLILASSRERIVRLFVMTMILALILAVYGLYIELYYGSFRFFRYYGGGVEWHKAVYIAWGYIVSSGAVVALALVIFSRFGSLKQLMAFVILAICAYFLLIAGGRGPFLGLVLAGLLAGAVQMPRIGRGRIEFSQVQFVIIGLFLLGLLFVIYVLASGETIASLNRFEKLLDLADDPLLRTGANRFDYFAAAYALWLKAPIIGHGLASFAALFASGLEVPGTHPHNIVLQALAEFGIIGLCLLGIFIWSGLRLFSFERLRNDPLSMLLIMMFVTFLMRALAASDLSTDYRLFFIVGLLAMRTTDAGSEAKDAEEEEAVTER